MVNNTDFVGNNKAGFKYGVGALYRKADAVYTDPVVSIDRGNFCIEALPGPITSKEISEIYYQCLPIKPSKDADMETQLAELELMKKVRIPLGFMNNMDRQFLSSLTVAYRTREEYRVDHAITIVSDDSECSQPISYHSALGADDGNGITLLGVGGCGKSEAVKRMLKRYPQVITHHLEIGLYRQIVWLYVVTPPNANLNDLYIAIGEAIDAALDNYTPWYKNIISRCKTVGQKASAVAKIINELNVGALILDEIQNIANQSVKSSSVDSILQIINTTKVSLNVIGTEDAFYGLFRKQYLVRRTGAVIIANDYCSDLNKFRTMLSYLTNINWFKASFELTEDIVEAFYDSTKGIISNMMSLWSYIQKDYIMSPEKPIITAEYIRLICNKRMPWVTSMTSEALEYSPFNDTGTSESSYDSNHAADIARARALEVRETIYGQINTTANPVKTMEVFQKVKENLILSDRHYTDGTVVKVICSVVSSKAGKDKDLVELTQMTLKRLKKYNEERPKPKQLIS